MLSYESAKVTILEQAQRQPVERVGFQQAMGRALAEELRAKEDQPPFDNSAVDGYAVRLADLERANPDSSVALPCQDYVYAGRLDLPELVPGQCLQVATGAPLPPGTEAVVMREHVQRDGDLVRFSRQPPRNNNLRRRGRDLHQGDLLFPPGTTLAPTHLALLAAQGLTEIPVHRPLRVHVLSTGSELVDPSQTPGPGQIREGNSYLLEGLIQSEACEVKRFHRVVDDLEGTKQVLREALQADVLLISGGVSVGDSDFVKPALQALGVEELFWRVAIKPGKPLFFGRWQQTQVFGLPGNPASTFVLFEELVRPYLRHRLGHQDLQIPLRRVRLTEGFAETSERLQLLRGHWYHENGCDWVTPLPQQGSFSIASIARANALIHMPPNAPPLLAGQWVWLRPLAHRFVLFSS